MQGLGLKIAAGSLSGCLAAALTNPTELLKTRLQVNLHILVCLCVCMCVYVYVWLFLFNQPRLLVSDPVSGALQLSKCRILSPLQCR